MTFPVESNREHSAGVMAAEKLKIGWIGVGFIGQVAHLANYAEMPEVQIVALAELRSELGQRVCRRYEIPHYYTDHSALLENADVEAVVAVVRRCHNGPVALDVLNSGRHVFTEKPMAATLDQAERLVSAATARNVRHAVGFMRRHDEGVQIGKRILDELRATQELGPILLARFFCWSGNDYCNISGLIRTPEARPEHLIWPIAPEWLSQRLHSDYDHFINTYIHDLNLIRFLMGGRPEIRHVEYRSTKCGVILFDFADFPGIFEFGTTNQNSWDEGVEIHFARGRLRIDLPPALLRNCPARVELYRDKGKTPGEIVVQKPDWTWSFRRQAQAFVQDVRSGHQPVASGTDSIEDMRFLEEIWKRIQDS